MILLYYMDQTETWHRRGILSMLSVVREQQKRRHRSLILYLASIECGDRVPRCAKAGSPQDVKPSFTTGMTFKRETKQCCRCHTSDQGGRTWELSHSWYHCKVPLPFLRCRSHFDASSQTLNIPMYVQFYIYMYTFLNTLSISLYTYIYSTVLCTKTWRSPISHSTTPVGSETSLAQAQVWQEHWHEHWLQRPSHQGGIDALSPRTLACWRWTTSWSPCSTSTPLHGLST